MKELNGQLDELKQELSEVRITCGAPLDAGGGWFLPRRRPPDAQRRGLYYPAPSSRRWSPAAPGQHNGRHSISLFRCVRAHPG